MSKTLKDLAALCGGQLSGDPGTKITNVTTIAEARENSLVFVLDKKNLGKALSSPAAAIVAPPGSEIGTKPAILVKKPRLAMAHILKAFAKECEVEPGVHKSAVVHKSAKLGKNVRIGALSYIGPNVLIGDETIIYPHVTLYQDTQIGKRCIIHSGTRLGMDGYGFEPADKGWEKIPQVGTLIIGDEVEIYSNVCIARGALGSTIIGSGTKIDNLTHIAHNCRIGENCAITGLVGFAGSVTLGKNVMVAGQAGFNGHITVGDNTVVLGRAGVTKDVPPNSIISGFPAIDHKEDLAFQAALRRLVK